MKSLLIVVATTMFMWAGGTIPVPVDTPPVPVPVDVPKPCQPCGVCGA